MPVNCDDDDYDGGEGDDDYNTGSRGQFSGIISRLPVGSCS